MELLLTGEPLTASDAWEWGLINQVVKQGSVLDAALALAARVTVNAPLSVQASKRVAYGVDDGVITDEVAGWERTLQRDAHPDQIRRRQGGAIGVRGEARTGLEGALNGRQDARILTPSRNAEGSSCPAGTIARRIGRGVLANTSARVSRR